MCENRICEEDELELDEDTTTDEENRPLMMKLNLCSGDNKEKKSEIQGIPFLSDLGFHESFRSVMYFSKRCLHTL